MMNPFPFGGCDVRSSLADLEPRSGASAGDEQHDREVVVQERSSSKEE